jgi:hypothetical protein
MKTLLAVLMGCFIFALADVTLACGNSCGKCSSCEAPPRWNECNCSDPNSNRNSCMSHDKYCEAFGNPGAT